MTSKAPGLEAREKHKFQKATISGDILDVAAEEGAAKDPVQSFWRYLCDKCCTKKARPK